MLPSASPYHNIIAIIGLGGLFSVLAYSIYPGTPAQWDAGTAEELQKMATVEEIGQEKQRIAERLARLDAERAKLAEQLNELEIAERVLSRFGRGAPPPWRSVAAGDARRGPLRLPPANAGLAPLSRRRGCR